MSIADKITKYVSIKAFVISALVGFVMMYFHSEERKKVYVYPTFETLGKGIFQDKSGACFAQYAEPVKCPSDRSKINQIPVQS